MQWWTLLLGGACLLEVSLANELRRTRSDPLPQPQPSRPRPKSAPADDSQLPAMTPARVVAQVHMPNHFRKQAAEATRDLRHHEAKQYELASYLLGAKHPNDPTPDFSEENNPIDWTSRSRPSYSRHPERDREEFWTKAKEHAPSQNKEDQLNSETIDPFRSQHLWGESFQANIYKKEPFSNHPNQKTLYFASNEVNHAKALADEHDVHSRKYAAASDRLAAIAADAERVGQVYGPGDRPPVKEKRRAKSTPAGGLADFKSQWGEHTAATQNQITKQALYQVGGQVAKHRDSNSFPLFYYKQRQRFLDRMRVSSNRRLERFKGADPIRESPALNAVLRHAKGGDFKSYSGYDTRAFDPFHHYTDYDRAQFWRPEAEKGMRQSNSHMVLGRSISYDPKLDVLPEEVNRLANEGKEVELGHKMWRDQQKREATPYDDGSSRKRTPELEHRMPWVDMRDGYRPLSFSSLYGQFHNAKPKNLQAALDNQASLSGMSKGPRYMEYDWSNPHWRLASDVRKREEADRPEPKQ